MKEFKAKFVIAIFYNYIINNNPIIKFFAYNDINNDNDNDNNNNNEYL